MRLSSWLVVAAAAAVAVSFGSVLAASDTCSVFEIHTTIQVIDGVLSSSECADYVNEDSSLKVLCAATSCVAVLGDLVPKLPNRTLTANDNGDTSVNKKSELQNHLDKCSADSSSSVRVDAVDTSTNGASISVDECTRVEASTTAQLYWEAAGSSACGPYSSMDESSMEVYINAPCSTTQCLSVMGTLVEQLPDCYSSGVNLKQDVMKSLASCTGDDSLSSRSSDECSNSEVSSLAYLTNSIVTSSECSLYVMSTSTEWYIAVPCSATACLSTLASVVRQMPYCQYEGVNYREELGLQQSSCLTGNGDDSSTDSLRTQAPDASVNSTGTRHNLVSVWLLLLVVTLVATE
ncbi:hypothetical protein PHYSODRAFT_516499 [Phytophthora sojae]|uniref:Elicitin n=2 Tax=Phytophthora sojae TaxID=67593 RepID=G4ZVQ6_PHYSP|nr:hypothetical protein PHYSODRAFT_516499 [Phytophthora sojae]ABB56015.1 elicitin-like protein SOL13H [Phytophthora sojae]EGZ11520.1 hypothetical protein PHYSODRAFT_516499 [Phytophthora sojae]|eukprot:XP_009531853.1 hypothetical protein PHYSODRAFT_516499 [Phytophthora sojae]